jgi:hypothetical protein
LCLFVQFFIQFGGVEEYLEKIGAYRAGLLSGTGVYTFPMTVLLPIAFLLHVSSFINKNIKAISNFGSSFYFYIINIVCFQLILGFRIPVVVFALQLLYLLRHTNLMKKHFLKIILFLFVILVVYGILRGGIEAGNEGLIDSRSIAQKIFEPIVRSRPTDVTAEVIKANSEYRYFKKVMVEPFVLYLNRLNFVEDYETDSNLFGKAIMSRYLYDTRDYEIVNYGGLNPGIVGWSLWQAGPLGLILFSIVFSILLNAISGVIQNSVNVEVLSSILFSCLVVMIDNPQVAINNVFTYVTCYIFCKFFFQKKVFK